MTENSGTANRNYIQIADDVISKMCPDVSRRRKIKALFEAGLDVFEISGYLNVWTKIVREIVAE